MKRYFKWILPSFLIIILVVCSFMLNAQNPIITMVSSSMISCKNGWNELYNEYSKLSKANLVLERMEDGNVNEREVRVFEREILPDLVELSPKYLYGSYSGISYSRLINEGKIVAIDSYIKNSKILKEPNTCGWQTIDNMKVNGKVYGFPISAGNGCVTYVRKDWLDNLGLSVPTTWDELYKVMWEFTYNDPDGNGKNDTYGYVFPTLGDEIFLQDFFQDANYDFVELNGKWVDGFVEPAMKKALERLCLVYRNGIIDKDSFRSHVHVCREKIQSGKSGIFQYFAGSSGLILQNETSKRNIKANLIAIPAIMEVNYLKRVDKFLTITKSAKDPKNVFENTIALMHDGNRGQMLFTYGVEGIHYRIKNGIPEKLSWPSSTQLLVNNLYLIPELTLNDWDDPFIRKESKTQDSFSVLNKKYKFIKIKPFSQNYMVYCNQIKILKVDLMLKIIEGEYSIDEGLSIYKQKAKELKVEQILKEFNENM